MVAPSISDLVSLICDQRLSKAKVGILKDALRSKLSSRGEHSWPLEVDLLHRDVEQLRVMATQQPAVVDVVVVGAVLRSPGFMCAVNRHTILLLQSVVQSKFGNQGKDTNKELATHVRHWLRAVGLNTAMEQRVVLDDGKEGSEELPIELIIAETFRIWGAVITDAATSFPELGDCVVVQWLLQVHLDGILLDPRRSARVLECLNSVARQNLNPILHQAFVGLALRIAKAISRPADAFCSLLTVTADGMSVCPIESRWHDMSMNAVKTDPKTITAEDTWALHPAHRSMLLVLLGVLMRRMIPGKEKQRCQDLHSLLTWCPTDESTCWHRFVRWIRPMAMAKPVSMDPEETQQWKGIEAVAHFALPIFHDGATQLLTGEICLLFWLWHSPGATALISSAVAATSSVLSIDTYMKCSDELLPAWTTLDLDCGESLQAAKEDIQAYWVDIKRLKEVLSQFFPAAETLGRVVQIEGEWKNLSLSGLKWLFRDEQFVHVTPWRWPPTKHMAPVSSTASSC